MRSSYQKMLASIPYLQLHDLELERACTVGEAVVAMELRHELTNHVGIFHAGAIFTLAETAAGIAAQGIIVGESGFILLAEATVRYTRRAEGKVHARAWIEPEQRQAALHKFRETGHGRVLVKVETSDTTGAVVFEGSFEYALRRGSIATSRFSLAS